MKVNEKIKLIRTINGLTQQEFADKIGTSRANLTNIELGNVTPTALFINCVSALYNVDKEWLYNEDDNLSELSKSVDASSIIAEKYNLLDEKYKKFVENQIIELLKLQDTPPK